MLRSWNSSSTMVRKCGEERILLQPRGQDAFGGDQQPRVARPNRRSNRTCQPTSRADRPAALVRDALRDGARGDAPRLQQDDRAVGAAAPAARASSCRRRAGPSRRPHANASGAGNRVDERIDRKRFEQADTRPDEAGRCVLGESSRRRRPGS